MRALSLVLLLGIACGGEEPFNPAGTVDERAGYFSSAELTMQVNRTPPTTAQVAAARLAIEQDGGNVVRRTKQSGLDHESRVAIDAIYFLYECLSLEQPQIRQVCQDDQLVEPLKQYILGQLRHYGHEFLSNPKPPIDVLVGIDSTLARKALRDLLTLSLDIPYPENLPPAVFRVAFGIRESHQAKKREAYAEQFRDHPDKRVRAWLGPSVR